MNEKRYFKIFIMFIIVIVLLIANAIYNIAFIMDFSKQKANGNEKWLMVEDRIVNMEEQIRNITKEE